MRRRMSCTFFIYHRKARIKIGIGEEDFNGFLHFLDQSEKGFEAYMIGSFGNWKGFRFTYSVDTYPSWLGWEERG